MNRRSTKNRRSRMNLGRRDRRFLGTRLWGWAMAACLLGWAAEAYGCPTCKDGIAASDPQAQSMAAGYYYSILFMMSMPFIILATFGTFAYRSVVKARATQPPTTPAVVNR